MYGGICSNVQQYYPDYYPTKINTSFNISYPILILVIVKKSSTLGVILIKAVII